jgi:hypothetical protein
MLYFAVQHNTPCYTVQYSTTYHVILCSTAQNTMLYFAVQHNTPCYSLQYSTTHHVILCSIAQYTMFHFAADYNIPHSCSTHLFHFRIYKQISEAIQIRIYKTENKMGTTVVTKKGKKKYWLNMTSSFGKNKTNGWA